MSCLSAFYAMVPTLLSCRSPEDAKLKEKMTATATHDTIKRGLQCSVVLQCNDEGDLELASVLENVQKFTH